MKITPDYLVISTGYDERIAEWTDRCDLEEAFGSYLFEESSEDEETLPLAERLKLRGLIGVFSQGIGYGVMDHNKESDEVNEKRKEYFKSFSKYRTNGNNYVLDAEAKEIYDQINSNDSFCSGLVFKLDKFDAMEIVKFILMLNYAGCMEWNSLMDVYVEQVEMENVIVFTFGCESG
jgi:hypothetical protein